MDTNVTDLGPYTVTRRYRGVGAVGRVYEAFHRVTGAPALVVAPGAADDWRAGPFEVRATGAAGYVALEVVQAPAGPRPLVRLGELLDVVTAAVEGVESRPAALAHLTGASTRERRWRAQLRARPAFRWGLGGAVVAALAALLMVHWPETRELEPVPVADRAEPERAPLALVDMAEEKPTRPFPSKLLPGQRRAPCLPRIEVQINGTCWVEHTLRPEDGQCPAPLYGPHKGRCYLPAGERDVPKSIFR